MSLAYSPLRLAGKYLRYYLMAANGRGHGIHSPFIFDFVVSVLNDRSAYPAYTRVEGLRRRLLQDQTLLTVEDRGAGSAYTATRSLSVAAIARRAAKPPRLGQLLFRIAQHYQPVTVVELGTSLGLSAAYLASGASGALGASGASGAAGAAGALDGGVFTLEGAPAVAEAADRNLRSLGLNVSVVTGDFDATLLPLLGRLPPVELAFVDGNHRREPTLRYFDVLLRHSSRSAALIFDDIHWSEEMEAAWGEIRRDPRVYLTIDLFFVGIVFLRDEFKVKQDFIIRY
jgi:predicted O-methyltransferase YrrM